MKTLSIVCVGRNPDAVKALSEGFDGAIVDSTVVMPWRPIWCHFHCKNLEVAESIMAAVPGFLRVEDNGAGQPCLHMHAAAETIIELLKAHFRVGVEDRRWDF